MTLTIHFAPPFVISVMDVDLEPYMCIYMYTARDPSVERMHPYHRLKTLRYGIGNALSNAIESHVPSAFCMNLIKFTWAFLE